MQPTEGELELLVCDVNGVPRGKTIAAQEYASDNLPHLAEAVLFQTITGDYAHVMETYDPEDRDILLQACWDTCRPTSWRPGQIHQVICDSLSHSGGVVQHDSRATLKQVLACYEAQGLHPILAPEIEFYLLRPLGDDTTALQPATGLYGSAEFGGEAFNPDALDKFAPVLDEIRHCAELSGLELTAVVHEMGPAQVELNVGHGPALARIDQLFQLKRLIKGCAARHGMLASFMAKPLEGLPGNGLHMHVSVQNGEGENQFALQGGKAGAPLLNFIGGLQTYLPEAFALVAPNVNSYKRFVRDLSAPINLEWGYDNRTTGLRVPFSDDQAGRVENRVAGADANPYLAAAALLACGYLGLKENLSPSAPVDGYGYDLQPNLPENLAAALTRLQGNATLVDLLGQPIVDAFVSVKQSELDAYAKQVTPWEVQFLGSTL